MPSVDSLSDSLPVALQRLGWKGETAPTVEQDADKLKRLTSAVYLIFLIWDIIEVVVIYLVVVETKGLTLEEINEVFENEQPKQYSEQLQREIREARRRLGE